MMASIWKIIYLQVSFREFFMQPIRQTQLPIQSILWWFDSFLVKQELENVLMRSESSTQSKNPYQGLSDLDHRVRRRTSSRGNCRTKCCGLSSSNSAALILWYSLAILVTFVFLTLFLFSSLLRNDVYSLLLLSLSYYPISKGSKWVSSFLGAPRKS